MLIQQIGNVRPPIKAITVFISNGTDQLLTPSVIVNLTNDKTYADLDYSAMHVEDIEAGDISQMTSDLQRNPVQYIAVGLLFGTAPTSGTVSAYLSYHR